MCLKLPCDISAYAPRGFLFFTLLLACGLPLLPAQPLQIDRGMRVNGLWCFPVMADPDSFVYLPDQGGLTTGEEGHPEFSLLRYVINRPGAGDDARSITQADGGAILHFLVSYGNPEEQVREAEAQLRKLLKRDTVVIRGPIVFSEGRYALISSIINPSTGTRKPQLLATGRAPVLEGNHIALSFDLEPQQSALLLQSFQMATPDISMVFDMSFQGVSEAYDADLFIDWSEVRHSQGISAGGNLYFVSADVEVMFDRLMRDNAIRLRSSGTDASMEALLSQVYDKLLELMFRKVEPERVPRDQRGGLMDALSMIPGLAATGSGGSKPFGLYAGYQLKDLRASGTSVLSFNHRATVERHAFITFNIGGLYQQYGSDHRFFRTANLSDDAFRQREIPVAVDGALSSQFDRYINNVSVQLRKKHQDGTVSLEELLFDTGTPANEQPRLVYGWSGDHDREAWLEYEFRTRWSFKGGGSFETQWRPSRAAMLDLFAPFDTLEVMPLGDLQALADEGVRAVVILVEYPFFGEKRRRQVVLKPGDLIEEKSFEITLPAGYPSYSFSITWQFSGGRRLATTGTDSSGLIFIDELPES